MKLKGPHCADVAEIQEAVTDELKTAQTGEYSTAFQKLYDRVKACIYANGAYFELKKIYPETFVRHCVGYFLSPDCVHRMNDSVVPQQPMRPWCSV
jgi:hypothetical protein